MNEEAVIFGESASLVGIATAPDSQRTRHAKTAVVLLNPGIVHRVGAGRIYVKVARSLASVGFTTLRFDFSGIGDSPVRPDSLQFEKSAIAETRSAMDFLAQENGIERFVLMGGCSGAKVAFDTACSDSRVIGALLINFPCVEEEDQTGNGANSRRAAFAYYRRLALFDLRSWRRLITGKAHYRQLISAMWNEVTRRICVNEATSAQAAKFRSQLCALIDRNVRLKFICAEGDHRLDDLKHAGGKLFKRSTAGRKVTLDIIRGADHTFSSLSDQKRLVHVLLERVDAIAQGNSRATALPLVAATSRVFPQLQS